jgi:hypothetical protein
MNKVLSSPKTLLTVLSGLILMNAVSSVAMAEDVKYRRVFDARTQTYIYQPEQTTSQKARNVMAKPVVKHAAVGAAAGVAAGALSDKSSVLKGAAIGAAAGVGSGLLNSSTTLNNRPMIKNTLRGAAVGTAASAVFGKSMVKGAAIGGAAGAGTQLIRDYMDKR